MGLQRPLLQPPDDRHLGQRRLAQSGSEADSASGDSHDSYSGGGNFTDSGTNSGSGYDDTWSVPISEQEGGYDDSYCGGTTNYVLDSSGNWDATSVASASGGASASDGGPWQSGDGDAWTSYSGTGPYTDTDSADDATVSGTLNESGSDDVSYNLQSSTSGSGSPIGTETVVNSASAHDDYAGSGPYTDTGGQSGPGDDQTYDGTGWQQEGGYDDLSVGDTANYGLGGPGSYWANSGSGAESASGDGWNVLRAGRRRVYRHGRRQPGVHDGNLRRIGVRRYLLRRPDHRRLLRRELDPDGYGHQRRVGQRRGRLLPRRPLHAFGDPERVRQRRDLQRHRARAPTATTNPATATRPATPWTLPAIGTPPAAARGSRTRATPRRRTAWPTALLRTPRPAARAP